MQLFLKIENVYLLDKRIFTLNIENPMPIEYLKALAIDKIIDHYGILGCNYVFTHSGKMLLDNMMLSDYNITDNSTIMIKLKQN